MAGFHRVAAAAFAVTCAVSGAAAQVGEAADSCVERPHSVSLASVAGSADFVVSAADSGNLTVMEVQGNYARGETAIRQAVASRFYATHPDDYDFLFVFTTFEFETGDARAFHNILRNDTAGIGRPMIDVGAAYGSAARLQGYIDMAAMSRYSFLPGTPTYRDVFDTLAHEVMHRWGMEVHFIDAAGHDSADLLGRDGAHWSYFLDSDASLMLGNDWVLQDNGSFRSVDTRHRYSQLDLYLAGFAAPSEVDPFVLIRGGTGALATDLPKLGAISAGTAETITIDQVIAASGPRVPSAADSQKDFSAAMVLLKRPGETVPVERLLELERFRARAEQQMAEETDGRATLRVFTRPKGPTVGLPEILHGSGQAATPPGIAAAVAWLEQRQAADGHWQDRAATAMRDTVAAVRAIEELDPGFTNLALARAWLESQVPANDDQRSWRLAATRSPGDVATLAAAQAASGGFGIHAGWNAGAFDTALSASALRAEASPANLDAALQFVASRQNADGSFGVADGGRGRILPTLRAAALFAAAGDSVSAPHLQNAIAWMNARSQADDGVGSGQQGALSETIEAYSLLGQVPLDASVAAGMRSYVNRGQQVGGDWGGSVYLTAVAMLAYGHNERPNLAFVGAPSVSPLQLRDGERATLAVTVVNTGNVPVGASVLRWYDGDPLQGGAPIAPDVAVPDLAANSRAILSSNWDTTGFAGTHALWAVLDANASIDEASELDNRSHVDVTVSAPSSQPDLMLVATDFTLDPPAVSSLPSEIHLAGVVRNIGTQDAHGAKVHLYAKPDLAHVIAEATVDVSARGTTPVALDFSATTAHALDLLLRADPGHVIAEGNETNNDANLVLPYGQSLDLEVLPTGLVLATSPVLVGRPVAFDVTVRNRGTVDSPPVVLRAVVTQDGTDVTISDDPVQVPAGQTAQRRLTWLPFSPGPARLRVALDPAGQVSETDEGNNEAEVDFAVEALDQPDLTFVSGSLELTPTPGLQGQPLQASIGVRNLSSVTSNSFVVALYPADPQSGVAPIGSTTVASLAGSSATIANIVVPDLGLVGDQRLFVKIDAGDAIDEVDESNNVVVKTLRVASLPDIAISVADVALSPPLPVHGSNVEARVTVRNLGGQAAHDVPVRLLEGDQASGIPVGAQQIIPELAAGGTQVLVWNWTLGLANDSRVVTAIADPDGSVREGSEDNNVAALPFDVQDGDFFASERYISPNGDGVKDVAAIVFRMPEGGVADVEVANGAHYVVRRYTDVPLNADLRGQVIWDGRDDRGRVVSDGDYRMVAVDSGHQRHDGPMVTVDNNASSFLQAVDTLHGVYGELPNGMSGLRIPPDSSPLHDQVFGFWHAQGATNGLYRSDALYPAPVPVISGLWLDAFGEANSTRANIVAFEFSQDGSEVVAAIAGTDSGWNQKTWIVRTAVDRMDAPSVVGTLENVGFVRVLGYFDSTTIVAGPASDGLPRVFDLAANTETVFRALDGSEALNVLPSGIAQGYPSRLTHFIPRDPARPAIDLLPGPIDNGEVYETQVSPDATALAIHYRSSVAETIELVDLVRGTRKVLASAAPGSAVGPRSQTELSIGYLGMGWMRNPDRLLLQDAATTRLETYSKDGVLLMHGNLPVPHRTGQYDTQNLAGVFAAASHGSECGQLNEPVGSQRRFHDPTTNSLFVGVGESVARDVLNEGWQLVLDAGVREYSSVDADTGEAEPIRQGTLVPLLDEMDKASYPLMQPCIDLPPADWPQLILRDGARIRADGRVQSLDRGIVPVTWPEQGDNIEQIWADDSAALLTQGRVFSTLTNLHAVLRARTLGRGIELSGIAADRNFASYRLDWAPIENPGAMQTLTAATTDEVIKDEFLTWVPPQPGTFVLRLTVVDKAGNIATSSATAASFDSSAIDTFSLAPRYFSPNGDGVQDLAIAKYRVRQPITLAIRIVDEHGVPVRSVDQTWGVADLGMHEFDWDGRNDAGQLVPDGRYRFMVDGFAAWVTLDTAAPDVAGDVPPVYVRQSPCVRGTDAYCPRRVDIQPMTRRALRDRNATTIRLESAPIGSDAWSEVETRFDDAPAGNPDPHDERNWIEYPLQVAGYAARRFRTVATDVAGNVRTLTLGDAEDVLVLYRADAPPESLLPPTVWLPFFYQEPPFTQAPDRTAWQPVVVEREVADDYLEAANAVGGLVRVAVETADVSTPDQWVERGSYPLGAQICANFEFCLPADPGWLRVPLDLQAISPGALALVRLRGERADGSRVYSNQGYIRAGGIDAPVCVPSAGGTEGVRAREYYPGPLREAVLHYLDVAGVQHSQQMTRADDENVYFPQIGTGMHDFWVSGTDGSGREHRSPHVPSVGCIESVDRWETHVFVAPVVRDQCDGLPSNQIRLGFTLMPLPPQTPGAGEPQPHHLSFGYVDGISGMRVTLFEAEDPVMLEEEFTISTENWPEALQPASLDMEDAHGRQWFQRLELPITHQAPQIDVVSPGNGEHVCAIPVPTFDGRQEHKFPFSVDVRAATPSGYRLGLGSGDAPSMFMCQGAFGESYELPPRGKCPGYNEISGFLSPPLAGVVEGAFGGFNGLATLQMKGLNWSGGTVCKQRTFVLDSAVEFAERMPPRTVMPTISAASPIVGVAPTGDTEHAQGLFFLRAEEPVGVDASVYRATIDGHGKLVLSEPVLANLMHVASTFGDIDVAWNGSVDGQLAADGLYGIAIDATDECGLSRRITYGALVDATPPVVEFSAPATGSTVLAPVVQVLGSVRDLRVAGWQLDFATADSPDTWHRIASGLNGVPPGNPLAAWSRGSLRGNVDLRLTAFDAMGNRSETHLPLVLGEPPTLIGGIELQPPLFSPNADGVLDAMRAQLALLHDANVDLRIVDAGGATVASLYAGPQSAGSSGYLWDGKDAQGHVVPDGAYQVRVAATDPGGVADPESAMLAVVVDATSPAVQVTRPVGAHAAADSTVALHLGDAHFAHYEARLDRADSGAVVASSQGDQGGDILLASLAGFEEVRYTLHVVATDAAGNTTTVDTGFDLDATAPAVSLTEPTDEALVAATATTSIKGSIADDHLATWALEVAPEHGDAWSQLKTGTANVPPGELLGWQPGLPDGRYRLRLRATDEAGNASEAVRIVEVDATPPVAQITAPVDGGYLRESAVIEGRATDAHFAGYRLSVIAAAQASGGQWSDIYAGTEPVDGGRLASLGLGLPENDYLLRLTVTDRVGLSSTAQVHVRIDSQAPPVPIGLVGQVLDHRDAALEWTAVDAGDLAGYIVYRGDERVTPTPVVPTHYIDRGAPEGNWSYRVRAIDLAGNESAPSNTVALLIDHTAPVAQIVRPVAAERVRGAYDVVGTAYSGEDFKRYTVSMLGIAPPHDAITIATGTLAVQGRTLATLDTTGLDEEASIRLHLEAEDTHGNIGQVDVDVVIDNLPPSRPTGLVAALNGADAQVHWNANTETDLLGYLLYRDNELVNATSPNLPADLRPFALTDVQYLDAQVHDGRHSYVVHAIDRAGNVSAASDPASLDPLDNTPPSMTIESPANDTRFETGVTVLATSRDTDIADVRFAFRAQGAGAWTDIGSALTAAPYRVTWTPAPGIPHGDYEIRALARDAGGRIDPAPPVVRVQYADLTPPDAPADLVAHAEGGTVHLAWAASRATDVAGYRVRQDGWDVGSVPADTTTFDDIDRVDGHYTYTVRAFDSDGNESPASNMAPADVFSVVFEQPYSPTADASIVLAGRSARPGNVTLHIETGLGQADVDAGATTASGAFTLPAQALEPGNNHITLRVTDILGNVGRLRDVWIDRGAVPAAPTGLAATVDDRRVELAWTANSEADVIGYRVFRNGEALVADGLLGELPVASTENGSGPERATDGDPQTYWEGYARDIESTEDASLQLAWADPRIVTGLDLTWMSADSGHFDVLAWSGRAWVRVARSEADVQAPQALVFERPYRTTRLKLQLRGPGSGTDSYYAFRLAEVQVRERVVQGATSVAETVTDGVWRYRISAVSALAFESPLSDETAAAVGDAQGPDPVVLSGSATGHDATLEWTASDSPDVASYALERDGQRIASIDASQPREYVDAGLPNGEHAYVVYGIDAFGNQGPPSNAVSLVVAGSVPGVPANLVVTAPDGGGLDLAWQAGVGEPAVLYRVRRAPVAEGPFELIVQTPATAYHDEAVIVGTTYYYTVEAVDALGNGSGRSAIASGTPRGDHVAPASPVLTWPTTAAVPWSTTWPETPVCGLAEAGASVSIDRGGLAFAAATATPAYATRTVSLLAGLQSPAPSSSGRFVAAVSDEAIRVSGLQEPLTQYVTDGGRGAVWAAHRDVVYFASNSGTVMRWVPGDSAAAAVDTVVDVLAFAVDPSEATFAMAGTSVADSTDGVWLVDAAGGAPRRVGDFAADALSQAPAWSPDGTRLVLIDGSENAHLVDVATATVVRSWPVDSYVQVVWSPDGSHLGYAIANAAGGDDLRIAVAADGSDDRVIASDARYMNAAAWSPAGGAIALLFGDALDILAPQTGVSLLPMPYVNADAGLSPWWTLAWTPSGRIVAGNDTSMLLLDPPGWFCADATLVPDMNRISARATDAAGNRGFDSRPIDVTFDAGARPDLVVAPGDIFIVPPSGSIGQRYDALVTVRNVGNAGVEHAVLSATLRAPDGSEVALVPGAVPALAAHAATGVTIPIGTLASPGTYYVRVTVDPLHVVAESDEGNNSATVAFAISADGAPVLDLGLSRTIFAPGETVRGEIAVTNPGAPFDGYVRIDVEDAAGFAVAALDDIALPTLGFGQHWQAPVAWDPDGVLAGDYRLRARLHRASGERVSERVAAFSLQAVRHLQLGLSTEASAVGIGHDVVAHSAVSFSAGNALIEGAVLRLGVFDAGGTEVWHREQALGILQPGYELARDDAWPTAGRAEGAYTLRLTLLSAQYSAIAEAGVTLTAAVPTAALTGNLRFEPGATLVAGQGATLRWSATNAGSTPLAGVQARVRIVSAPGQNPVAQAGDTFDLDVNAVREGSMPLAAPPLALGAYSVFLEARIPGDAADQWRPLARQGFNAVDGMPPEIDLHSPVAATTTPAVAPLVAAVVDRDSIVVAVEASVDGGNWQPLGAGADGLYARGLGGLVDGAHTVVVRARDGWGNEAQTTPRAFFVDATPPLITVDGVSDGELANHDVAPTVSVVDAHLQDVAITLDNASFVSGDAVSGEGAHVLLVHATDAAGNSSIRSVRFTIDRTAPPIQIAAPADGSVVTQSAVRVDVRSEAGAELVLVTGAYSAPATVDAAGEASFDAVPLVTGLNHIEVVASDRAGNTSAPAAISVTYEVNVVTPLAGTLQPSTATLAQGAPLAVHAALHNPNASGLAAQHLRVVVVDGSATQLAEQVFDHDFAAHEDHAVDLVFDSTAWALGSIEVRLELAAGVDWTRLDTEPLDVVDLTPPLLALVAPLAGDVIGSPVTLRASASDVLTGVATVEYQLDGGDWIALASNAGTYESLPLGLSDGDHDVALQAHDGAGNPAHVDPVHFAVDTLPPLINIAGVADGDLLAHAVAPAIDITDAHLFTSDVRLNGSPYVSGTPIGASGDYVLDAIATDLAGNEASTAVHFTIDVDAPLVVFTAPANDAVVDTASVDVAGRTEANAHVHLSTGAFAVNVDAGDDGMFAVAQVPLQPGANTIVAHATDRAGNIGPDVQLVVMFSQPLAAVDGQIGAIASPLPYGEPIVVPYAAQNTGALPLAALPLRLELRDDANGDLASSDDFTLDLPLAAGASGERALPAAGLAAGGYVLTLLADLPGDSAGWLVLDSRDVALSPAHCVRGDMIFVDGFDGTGIIRDGLIFCDGFDVASIDGMPVAAQAPWLGTTAWIAAIDVPVARRVATVRATARAPRQHVASRSSEPAIHATPARPDAAGKTATTAAAASPRARHIDPTACTGERRGPACFPQLAARIVGRDGYENASIGRPVRPIATMHKEVL